MDAQGDPSSLHDLAVDAQTDIQKLATGLAHAGADPQAVHQLTAMAELLSQVVKVLAEGPSLDQGAGGPAGPPGAPPAPAAPQGPPTVQHAAPGPPQQQAAPQGGAGAGSPPPHEQVAKHSLQAATHALHASMIQSKQARETGQ